MTEQAKKSSPPFLWWFGLISFSYVVFNGLTDTFFRAVYPFFQNVFAMVAG